MMLKASIVHVFLLIQILASCSKFTNMNSFTLIESNWKQLLDDWYSDEGQIRWNLWQWFTMLHDRFRCQNHVDTQVYDKVWITENSTIKFQQKIGMTKELIVYAVKNQNPITKSQFDNADKKNSLYVN